MFKIEIKRRKINKLNFIKQDKTICLQFFKTSNNCYAKLSKTKMLFKFKRSIQINLLFLLRYTGVYFLFERINYKLRNIVYLILI
jgi:hypothetical protein